MKPQITRVFYPGRLREIMRDSLGTAYHVDIDTINEVDWNASLRHFDDATLYQTWAYGRMKAGDSRLSHVLLWHQNNLVAMSQVRIINLSPLPSGIAYVHWGPLWKKRGVPPDLNHLSIILRAMREEYVHGRGLVIRILPKIVDRDLEPEIRSTYESQGFAWSPDPDQTFVIDISMPLEEIRARLQKDWRRDLRNAEKQELKLIEGTCRDNLAVAIKLTKEMKERKKFFGGRTSDLLEVQEGLPEDFKVKVIYAEHEKEPVAALGWQSIGRIGFPVIAATGNKGLRLRASFLLWWKMIEFYNARGFRFLDVGGVNSTRNPGGYLFKSRLVGKKNPIPDQYIGQFTASQGGALPILLGAAQNARNLYKHGRARLAKSVHSICQRLRL